MALGKSIKLCRTQRNMTQAELAQAVGISVGHLSLIERNKRDLAFSKVKKIAEALDIPVFLIVYFADENKCCFDPRLQEKLAHAALAAITEDNE